MTVWSQLYLIVDVECRMYECPACGALCRVHQYKRKLLVHQVLKRVTVIEARISKPRCETYDKYPQIPVPWTRPHVLYTKMLEREFFTLLGNSVNRTAKLWRD